MGATIVDFSYAEKVMLVCATVVTSLYAKEAIAGMEVACDY